MIFLNPFALLKNYFRQEGKKAIAENVKKTMPIRFFVGLIRLVRDGIIPASGLGELTAGVESKTMPAKLHPNV